MERLGLQRLGRRGQTGPTSNRKIKIKLKNILKNSRLIKKLNYIIVILRIIIIAIFGIENCKIVKKSWIHVENVKKDRKHSKHNFDD